MREYLYWPRMTTQVKDYYILPTIIYDYNWEVYLDGKNFKCR